MTNGNHSAFPSATEYSSAGQLINQGCYGLTKREYFAAMALQGALANPNRSDTPAEYAEFARMCAGALLTELAK